MRYIIEKDVFEKAPEFVRAVVLISGATNSKPTPELEQKLRQRLSIIATDDELSPGDRRIEAWTNVYRQFPSPRGERVRPSIGSLIRRIQRGGADKIPFISPLVAISNLVSLTYIVPSGLIDGERAQGDLILGAAAGRETFVPFGRDEPAKIGPGEIIYYDSVTEVVMCRAWNSQGGQATAIQPTTTRAVLDIDCLLSVIPISKLEEATEFASALAGEFCDAQTRAFFLSRSTPEVEFEF